MLPLPGSPPDLGQQATALVLPKSCSLPAGSAHLPGPGLVVLWMNAGGVIGGELPTQPTDPNRAPSALSVIGLQLVLTQHMCCRGTERASTGRPRGRACWL